MTEVSIRELRNSGGRVLDRVADGEHVVITRDGHPVAELRRVGRAALSATVLLERWRKAPTLDGSALRADLDGTLDSQL